jgi:long-subunit fatty acid transport protein
MPFVYPRRGVGHPGRVRPRGAACVALGVAIGLLAARKALAAPLDEPFVGGMSFSGPTSGNVAAVYWNPAAVGLIHGVQLMISASGRYATTTVSRAPINQATGLPGGTFSPGSATATDLSQPLQWPIGPGGFAGVAWDLGSDRFTLAFATYMPSVEQVHFPTSPAGDEPTRYNLLTADLRNLALVPALSIRFAGDLRIGFAPGFLFSTGHLAFAEDLALDGGPDGLKSDCLGMPCGAENPAAAARYDVNSGHGLGDAKFSVTLGGGLYYRRRSLEFGLAYSSRPIGSDVAGVEVAAEQTTVALPPRDPTGTLVSCGAGRTDRCVFGDISYRLPDVWTAGVTWHLRGGLELTAMVRWLWMHVHDRIDLRLTGPTLEAHGLPQHIVLYRGFQDVWDMRMRLSYWWHERVRVGAGLRVQTSAVPAAALSAGAVDGFTIQPTLLAEVQLTRRLWLGGGYALALMPQVTTDSSRFDPTAATACFQAGGNLGSPSCTARLEGRARPTAAGTYGRTTHDFGLTMTVRF